MSIEALIQPPKVWSRTEVFGTDCVPRSPGVYAWYFRNIPPGVPTEGCVKHGDLTLLYVGIAPKAPPKNGKPASSKTLRSRLRFHMQTNAYGSTLRMTLGCLLSKRLGIELRRVGSGKRMTFTRKGEAKLSAWMEKNALVCWTVSKKPWVLERKIIRSVNLPLNLAQNLQHPFSSKLRACRAAARERARALAVVQ